MGKLLVVDDEELVRESVTAILSAMGYSVVQARDGLEALILYQALRGEIMLVLMDVQMPRMDGLSAAQLIKNVDPNARIIILSGSGGHYSKSAEVDAYLPKPFRVKELRQTILAVLGEEDSPMNKVS